MKTRPAHPNRHTHSSKPKAAAAPKRKAPARAGSDDTYELQPSRPAGTVVGTYFSTPFGSAVVPRGVNPLLDASMAWFSTVADPAWQRAMWERGIEAARSLTPAR